jgi:hypothetical protein
MFQVVLALEGGYDLPAICDSAQECVRALLGESVTPISQEELIRPPCAPAVETLLRTSAIQGPHWPCIKRYTSLIHCSALEAAGAGSASKSPEVPAVNRERVESETVSAMASLSMRYHNEQGGGGGSESGPGPARLSNHHRRSSDNNMNEDSNSEIRRSNSNLRDDDDSEEPMDQDESGSK